MIYKGLVIRIVNLISEFTDKISESNEDHKNKRVTKNTYNACINTCSPIHKE